MNIIYDSAGTGYTVMRVSAPVGTAFSYEMRQEFGGVPDSIVNYVSGKLHRFCPDAIPGNPQGAGLPVDTFDKIGSYHFIVSEPAVWDCISPMGALSARVVAERITDSSGVYGDVYITSGRWDIDGEECGAPRLIIGASRADLLSTTGALYSNIHIEPLEP